MARHPRRRLPRRAAPSAPIWRVSLTPSDGAGFARRARGARAAPCYRLGRRPGLALDRPDAAAAATPCARRSAASAAMRRSIRATPTLARAGVDVFDAADRRAGAADPRRQGRASIRKGSFNPGRMYAGSCEPDANPFHRRAARRSAYREPREDPALLRALRLLHRDLPDLCRRPATSAIRPRGRIYLIKELLETGRAPDAHDVEPIDHCLSCLSCMTTCPSGVDYRRLIDHARVEVETRYARAPVDRVCCARCSCWLLPHRAADSGWRWGSPCSAGRSCRFSRACRRSGRSSPRCCALAPARLPARDATEGPGVFKAPAATAKRRRVALLTGCAQAVLAPQINAATIRLLNRAGDRRGAAEGRRLLRLARPSHGPRRAGARRRPRQYRRLDARDRRRRARRDRRHRLRLRRDDQGLRRDARRRSRLCRQRPRASRRWRRTRANISSLSI